MQQIDDVWWRNDFTRVPTASIVVVVVGITSLGVVQKLRKVEYRLELAKARNIAALQLATFA